MIKSHYRTPRINVRIIKQCSRNLFINLEKNIHLPGWFDGKMTGVQHKSQSKTLNGFYLKVETNE